MPSYIVHTLNVSEVVYADTPEGAASLSSYASVLDPVLSVELAEAPQLVASPLDTVIPSASAPEASEQPLTLPDWQADQPASEPQAQGEGASD